MNLVKWYHETIWNRLQKKHWLVMKLINTWLSCTIYPMYVFKIIVPPKDDIPCYCYICFRFKNDTFKGWSFKRRVHHCKRVLSRKLRAIWYEL